MLHPEVCVLTFSLDTCECSMEKVFVQLSRVSVSAMWAIVKRVFGMVISDMVCLS